jgi:hypothetical protein
MIPTVNLYRGDEVAVVEPDTETYQVFIDAGWKPKKAADKAPDKSQAKNESKE